jgi:hypothetical protein
MNPHATPYEARSQFVSQHSLFRPNYGTSNSLSSAGTNLRTASDCAITDTSAYSHSPTLPTTTTSQDQERRFSNMATYYDNDEHGHAVSMSSTPPFMEIAQIHPHVRSFEQRGDVVGAYLARRTMAYPAYGPPAPFYHESFGGGGYEYAPSLPCYNDGFGGARYEHAPSAPSYHQDSFGGGGYQHFPPRPYYQDGSNGTGYEQQTRSPSDSESVYYREHPAEQTYDSYTPQTETFNNHPEPTGHGNQRKLKHYPDPESVRHLHTLLSLVPNLQPARRFKCLYEGPLIDIVEQDTGTVLAYQVHKKMLVLFLGRAVINKYIRTLERQDPVNWEGGPVVQELSIPRGVGSRAAFRILVSWMMRASRPDCAKDLRQITIPDNTHAACTLSQILNLLGLHKDALRVDYTISKSHFKWPIYAKELETLWNCLGARNRYVYAAIKVVGGHLENDAPGSQADFKFWNQMAGLFEREPLLERRVKDLQLNEKYRPVFSTNWCKKIRGASEVEVAKDRGQDYEKDAGYGKADGYHNGSGFEFKTPDDFDCTTPRAMSSSSKVNPEKLLTDTVKVLRIVPAPDAPVEDDVGGDEEVMGGEVIVASE